jgi:hypothetical protein
MPRRRFSSTGVAALGVVAGAILLAACSGTTVPQAEGTHGLLPDGHARSGTEQVVQGSQSIPLHTANPRGSQGVVASGGHAAPYNYAPTVLETGGTYRMWWCSQLPGAPRPGDQILTAASLSENGPFTAPNGAHAQQAFGNSASGFDRLHTCDPSVIEVKGVYYLYYTGTSDQAGNHNAIGMATSTDGVHWNRADGGKPILSASGDVRRANAYGAGQPSALFLNGWFYLMFTDTTGAAADAQGAGQFVLRSPDPSFQQNVQALGQNGFAPVASATGRRTRSVDDTTTSDWMWVDALQSFAIAADGAAGTTITFWDANFTHHPYQQIVIGGAQREGPGLVRAADGHAPVSTADPCGELKLDVIRATGGGGQPNGLRHFGVDVTRLRACGQRATALALLSGFAVPAPDRTVDLVVGDQLVEVERRSVALSLAVGMLDNPPAFVATLPVVAHLRAGVPAMAAPGRPVGLALDGKLWVVGGATVAQLNSSAVRDVTDQQWDAYPRGADLSGLRP